MYNLRRKVFPICSKCPLHHGQCMLGYQFCTTNEKIRLVQIHIYTRQLSILNSNNGSCLNSLLNIEFLDWSKLKAFAEKRIKFG